MTDTEQTYLKQRFEDGTQVASNYGNQSSVCREFVDIRENSLHAGGSESLGFTILKDLEGDTKSEVADQLCKRIRELETTVSRQNIQIRNGEVSQRNYDAALGKLQRQREEIALLVEDRDRHQNESQFNRQQTLQKTRQCDHYEERISHMNTCLIDKDREIRDLERQVMFLKENSRQDTEDRIPPNGSLNFNKLEPNPSDSGQGADESGSRVKRRRHYFRKSLTSLPNCIHCQTVFDILKPHEIDCSFHRSLPQPLKVWGSQLDIHGEKFGSLDLNSYRFWPCCEKYGVKEPPGCLKLKSHELVFPDE